MNARSCNLLLLLYILEPEGLPAKISTVYSSNRFRVHRLGADAKEGRDRHRLGIRARDARSASGRARLLHSILGAFLVRRAARLRAGVARARRRVRRSHCQTRRPAAGGAHWRVDVIRVIPRTFFL